MYTAIFTPLHWYHLWLNNILWIWRNNPFFSHPMLLRLHWLLCTDALLSPVFLAGWEHSAWSLWHSWGFGTEVLWGLRPAWKGCCCKHGPNPGKAAEEAASHGSEYFLKPKLLNYEQTSKKHWLLVKGAISWVLVLLSKSNIYRGTIGTVDPALKENN